MQPHSCCKTPMCTTVFLHLEPETTALVVGAAECLIHANKEYF